TFGWEAALGGMRNPKNSWTTSASTFALSADESGVQRIDIGPADLKLAGALANSGPDDGKFLRMIHVQLDVTAPLYWWKEASTYKVGTVLNSCSTMHKIHAKEFELDDFSHEHIINSVGMGAQEIEVRISPMQVLLTTIECLNSYRKLYLETKDKKYWWQLIQLLPSSYNQRRTWDLNYAVLRNIYHARKNHKLDEWRELCAWIETLPYSELIIGKGEPTGD
uniref:hypothetical protein n=1 Tax=Alistipes putredinis TaxID=28117 RepID=UPI0040253706